MNTRFDGKTVIVTGASRGIGLACAERMAALGAKVAMISMDANRLADAVGTLQNRGTDVRGYALDLCKVSDIAPAISQIRTELGEIDVLIQAAALAIPRLSQNITEVEWDSVFNINTKALFFMMQAVSDQSMIPRRCGSIVNIASIAGLLGMRPPLSSAHYCASKGAVIQLSRQGAVEWGEHNVRVNAIAPAGVKTEKTLAMLGTEENLGRAEAAIPLRRFSEPVDVANGAAFLASDAARMITGHVLVIDGGCCAMG